MKVIAVGCPACEPRVKLSTECEGEHHCGISFGMGTFANVTVDGKVFLGAQEVWAGEPGRVIEVGFIGPPDYPNGMNVSVHECPVSGETTYLRRLTEYDSVGFSIPAEHLR